MQSQEFSKETKKGIGRECLGKKITREKAGDADVYRRLAAEECGTYMGDGYDRMGYPDVSMLGRNLWGVIDFLLSYQTRAMGLLASSTWM